MNTFEKIITAALAVVAAGSVTGMAINGVNNKKQAEAIEELKAKDAYLQRQINDLKKQYEELKAQEEADIARVTAEYQSKIDALTAQLNQTKNDLANLKSQESKDKTELLNKINSLTSQISSLQTQMNNKIKEIKAYYDSLLQDLEERIAELENSQTTFIHITDEPLTIEGIDNVYRVSNNVYQYEITTSHLQAAFHGRACGTTANPYYYYDANDMITGKTREDIMKFIKSVNSGIPCTDLRFNDSYVIRSIKLLSSTSCNYYEPTLLDAEYTQLNNPSRKNYRWEYNNINASGLMIQSVYNSNGYGFASEKIIFTFTLFES